MAGRRDRLLGKGGSEREMEIGKAVKIAMEMDLCMTTPDILGDAKIKPSHDGLPLTFMDADGGNPTMDGSRRRMN